MDWITDRQPTKEDEDSDGEVCMQRFPDGRISSIGLCDAFVAAAHVGPGVPWKRTGSWKSPAPPKPEPEPVPAGERWPLPRLFAAPIRRTFFPSGAMVIDAIADDGTCWQMSDGRSEWRQIKPLPPATEE